MSRYIIHCILAITCLVGLSSCSTAKTTKTLGEYGIPAYKSGVVGSFSVANVAETREETTSQGYLDVFVRHKELGTTYEIEFEEGGRASPFFIMLPPGTYRFVRGETRAIPPGQPSYDWRGPPVEFEVSRDQVTCIGTIRFEREGDRTSFPMKATLGDNVSGQWRVASDSCDSLAESVGELYPKLRKKEMPTNPAELKEIPSEQSGPESASRQK